MSNLNSRIYRGYLIHTVVTPSYPPEGGFVANVMVEFNGVQVGRDVTGNMSHFIFAETAAQHLGHAIVDAALAQKQKIERD